MTPMVRINHVGYEDNDSPIKCEIVAKCEFFNAGGSVKDRIGKRMIEDAEKSGRIKKGDTLIEPTSGNTGIGLALSAAIKGYKMIITLPEKMSNEKVYTLRALGAKIYRTPTEAAFDSPESHIGLANRLNAEIASSHILDQYSNPSNPLAHYDGTAEEIIKQCNGKVDMVVLTAGTGGTITGVAGKIKEKIPHCIVVGVDPQGSILAQPDSLNGRIRSYHVEGIGYDFVPQVLQRGLVDFWVKTDDQESFAYSRRLIREEGLLCGGSSGSCFAGALKAIRQFHAQTGINTSGKRVVVLLPDSIRNYMTKFLSDDWMIDNNFMEVEDEEMNGAAVDEHDWMNDTVAALNVSPPITMSSNLSCKAAIDIMKKKGIDQIPIMHGDAIYGVVTIGNLSSKLLKARVSPKDKVTKATFKKFKAVSLNTKLMKLSQIFNLHHFVLVVTQSEQYNDNGSISKKEMVVGIITRIDLLNYIVERKKHVQEAATPTPDIQDIE